MITSVLFDMGGTLEDIWSDAESEKNAIEQIDRMLKGWGLDPAVDYEMLKERVNTGWAEYAKYRDATNVELKPINIWCDYVLKAFDFPRASLEMHCEELAHMWEVTYYHRIVRPNVKEMLDGLKGMGLKLGIISNTASLYQVFQTLKDYGIRDCFQDVTLSSVTGLRKPGTDIFKVALCQLQSAPEECVYVGDTVSRDVIGSKRAGFACAIQIASKLTKLKDVQIAREFEPDIVVESIYDVYPAVRNLLQR